MKQTIEVPLCAHVKTNGTQCQSPAMSDSYFCYFHERLHQRHKRYHATEAKKLYLEHTRHIQLHAPSKTPSRFSSPSHSSSTPSLPASSITNPRARCSSASASPR